METLYMKDSYCSFCGSQFVEQILWPRKCFKCNNISYKNPIPVIVSMIGVETNDRMGIIIQQRNIEPEKGKWALPGGYINYGESWNEAAARENQEEMSISTFPEAYRLFDIKKSTNGNMLIFCRTAKIWTYQVMKFITEFVPNEEVSSLGIYYGDTELAFPSHNECASQFLKILQNTQSPWNY